VAEVIPRSRCGAGRAWQASATELILLSDAGTARTLSLGGLAAMLEDAICTHLLLIAWQRQATKAVAALAGGA